MFENGDYLREIDYDRDVEQQKAAEHKNNFYPAQAAAFCRHNGQYFSSEASRVLH